MACIILFKWFLKALIIISVIKHVSTSTFSLVKATDANLTDPCNNYTVLNDSWRSVNNTNNANTCDASVFWSGWYRLFINGLSAHIPDTCVAVSSCGTSFPLWIRGGHPTVKNGIVTRDVCGNALGYCCFYGSYPIRVKACPENYYVYELLGPTACNLAYCADVGSVIISSTAATPLIITPDPCYNYTVLNDSWRANSSQPSKPVTMCDQSVPWRGWYRLFINNLNAQIPDTCVEKYSCGTDYPMWIRGGHPTVEDEVVTRDVCVHAYNYCCYMGSYPVRIKACPGNYYVYELLRPTDCNLAYCTVVSNMNFTSTSTTVAPQTSSAVINITLQEGCSNQSSGGCLQNLLEQIENITAQELPLNTVTDILNVIFNASEKISVSSSSASPSELASYGNKVLKSSEKLISTLVKPTETSANVSFTLETVEGQVFIVGPQVTLEKIPQLDTTNSSVDIDLIGIAKNNNNRSAVAFMSYTTMENLLKADFFNTTNDTIKTMMSTVISATLPKTSNTALTKAVNFTFRHIREFDPNGSLSCVYWNISEWIVDGCSVLNSNSSHTVCSCVHLSTFALIMQTSSSPPPSDRLDLLNLVCVIVDLVFFSLALLSFALCQWSPGVNNVARINICISLLSAHLLFLLTQQFLNLIRPQQVLCVVIAGLLHFLFLSAFVWMFIEAVLLFICVKNLSRISSKKKEVLSSGFLCVIGYVVALVVVCVSIGLVPEGYGSEQCWIKTDKGFIWSFLGPVCVILALNTILFIRISISLKSALAKLNAEVSQMKQTKVMVFKTLGQFVVLGCFWILGFVPNSSEVLQIVFLILNSQQGTFIFLIYCVLNNEIRQQYWRCFKYLCSGCKEN
ncbi:adhesion G protein-coupled receptor E3-like [Danio aesculapii]|uniref:adhesion G protein-coupled receptor E3-like n=1 Tax=Danio aesculapii TaxID=1142201 RepID=UPI0024BF9246|nr:adhesion G protein-coupled receptor E3-like [Danio aesculapii]